MRYNADIMKSKTLVSIFVLIVTIILSVILYAVVVNAFPKFGSFENLLFLGLVTFGLCVGVWLSILIYEQGKK